MAKGADAEERHRFRPQAAHLGSEAPSTGDELLRRNLVRRGGGAIDEIGDAITGLQEQALLRRVQKARRKAGGVQRRPEAVARAREVMAGGGRVQARVDADEQHPQVGRHHIADAFAGGVGDVRRGGLRRPGG